MGLDATKPDIGACEQQRRRSDIVSTQSDQRLYCSLTGNYILTCFMQNFILASLCSRIDQFDSYLVRNSEDRFSRTMALMYLIPYLNQKDGVWNVIIDHVDLD